MENVHTYMNHTITLRAEKRDAGWVGKYAVMPLDPINTRSHTGTMPGSFATETEAGQAALEAAQRWIEPNASA